MSNRRYVLQKPLPDADAGTILIGDGEGNYDYTARGGIASFYFDNQVENNPDWFLPEQPRRVFGVNIDWKILVAPRDLGDVMKAADCRFIGTEEECRDFIKKYQPEVENKEFTSNFNDVPLGLYEIFWKSGGSSLAAVGNLYSGIRWIAPTNWTNESNPAGTMSDHYNSIEKMVLIKSKQPLKPDTKEERIEVIDFEFDRDEKWIKLHFKNRLHLVFKDDYGKIKQAIESVLNNDGDNGMKSLKYELKITDELLEERQKVLDAIPECEPHGKCIPHALEWIEIKKSKIYSQSELDEAIQKAEVNAWNFAREKMIIDGKPTERQYRFLSYYDYEIYKKSSETLYQQSLHTKTSKHWT